MRSGDRNGLPELVDEIGSLGNELGREINIMEVCGTHTVSLRKHGIHTLIPSNVRLLSGPGCPVCVTPSSYISNAVELIEKHDVLVTTFGDMLKVPDHTGKSLASYMGRGNLRILYSPAELLAIARETEREVVFLGVGFETTIPVVASAFLRAEKEGIGNLFLYPAFKLVPPALHALLEDPECRIDAFLLPGHVSAVLGLEPYAFLDTEYGIPSAVAGFEGDDLLTGIHALLRQLAEGTHRVENIYTRVVRERGNEKARKVMDSFLTPSDSLWRGFGNIPASGMFPLPEYGKLDAAAKYNLPKLTNTDPPGCLCSRVVQGKSLPEECTLFGKRCTPENPVGPCMVSSEGSCAAHFKYGAL